MRAFFAFESALQCWRTQALPNVSIRDRGLISDAFNVECSAEEAAWLKSQLGLSMPACCAVVDARARRRNNRLYCRVHDSKIPKDEYVRIGKESYVASPELTLAQLACLLKGKGSIPGLLEINAMNSDHVRAICLATITCELCGTYRLANNSDGFVASRAVTSIAKIQRFLDRSGNFMGRPILESALKISFDRSNSPMETACALLACMPLSYGGMGLGKRPQLNYPIHTVSKGKETVRYADLCWPDERVILEYNGSYHEGERANKDDLRRIELIAQGYTVVSVNFEQLMDIELFEEAVRSSLSMVPTKGRRLANFDQRRRLARAAIFESTNTHCRENTGRFVPPVIKP